MTADVTVVVPAYQAEDTIAGALASVAAQSVQPSEVVVVDDGSIDGTAKVARTWSAMLPLDVVRLEQNGGAARARNEGVARSSGSMLAFLDADDLWLPHHLERLLAVQRCTGGVVSGRAIQWKDGEDIIYAAPSTARAVDHAHAFDLEQIIRHHAFGMHALVPRDVFTAVGGFDEDLDGVEDWDLWVRIAQRGVPMHRTEVRTFIYRRRDSSLSGQIDRLTANGRRVLDRVERSGGADTPALRAAVRDSRALIAYNQGSFALEQGRYDDARRDVRPALRGPWRLATRAALIAAAPRAYARTRSARKTEQG